VTAAGATTLASEREGCALVTGASRGIGAAIACALAADGWPVGVNFKSDESSAAATVERIEGTGGRALAVRADVTAPEEVESLFGAVERELGRVLVLVNNAGVRADDRAL
jgi:3-oxoacyl-[acyl-carrier protein] reductase